MPMVYSMGYHAVVPTMHCHHCEYTNSKNYTEELDWIYMHVYKESHTESEVLTNFEGYMLSIQ